MTKRLEDAIEAYTRAFNRPIPWPFGISDAYLAEQLERAVKRGKPISPSFDWYKRMPPDAAGLRNG